MVPWVVLSVIFIFHGKTRLFPPPPPPITNSAGPDVMSHYAKKRT